MSAIVNFSILAQPDDATCGPTCLQAIYAHFGDRISLHDVIRGVQGLDTSGTVAVLLAIHALERGYGATIYTYNLHVFDPSWFTGDGVDLASKLRAQVEAKSDPRTRRVTPAYLRFLELGGRLRFRELTPDLLRSHLERGRPVVTGLSATYLYQSPRELGGATLTFDDVRGRPTGHFVVLWGYEAGTREVKVADPLRDNPPFGQQIYVLPVHRVLGAVLLGVLTHDANLLVLHPPGSPYDEGGESA